jgi:leader peptidase (prepilin peptidase)/N-methyltransferase
MSATGRRLTAVAAAVTVMPVLRWLILTHSVPPGQPWRTRCSCGNPLWPGACGPTGRCRACGIKPGPPGYLIEAITILAVAVAALPADGSWQTAAALWWTPGAVVLAAVDAIVRRLPHRLTTATAAGFIGLLALAGDTPVRARAIAGATVVTAAFAVAAWLARGQLGGGDIGLAVPVAAFLAAHSWMALLYGYLAGFAAAVAFLAVARIIQRPRRTVALGPFLLAGALIAVQL